MKGDGLEIIKDLIEGASQLSDPVEFNKRINQIYISKKAVKHLRELYRQLHFIQLSKQKQSDLKKKICLSKVPCQLNWPICTHFLESQKITYSDPGFNIILSTDHPVTSYMIEDYFTQIEHYKTNKIIFHENSLLVVRTEHLCGEKVVNKESTSKSSEICSEMETQVTTRNREYHEKYLQYFEDDNDDDEEVEDQEEFYSQLQRDCVNEEEADEEQDSKVEELSPPSKKLNEFPSRKRTSNSIFLLRKLSQKNEFFGDFIFENNSNFLDSDKKKKEIIQQTLLEYD